MLFVLCMYAHSSYSINFNWYLFSYTYIDDSFVPIIFLCHRAQILILQSLISNDYIVSIDEFFNWYPNTSFCNISFDGKTFSLVFHKEGEISYFVFQLVFGLPLVLYSTP